MSLAESIRARLRDRSLGGGLAGRSITSFALAVAGTGLGFIVTLFLTRLLGRVEYGRYAVFLGWVNVAVLIAKLNGDVVAARFVGAYSAAGDWGALRGFLRVSRRTIGLLSVLLLALAVAGAALRGETPFSTRELLLAACIVPSMALLSLSGASLQGFRRVVAAQAPSQIVRPIVLSAVAYSGIRWLGWHQGAQSALAANAIAVAVAVVLSWTLLRHFQPPEVNSARPLYEVRTWAHASGWLLLGDAFQLVVSQQSDVLVVGAMLTSSQAGVYAVASQLSGLILFGATAVAFAATPQVSALHASGDVRGLRRLLRIIAAANLAVSFPVAAGVMLMGKFALGIFGGGFVRGYPVLLVLCGAQLVAAGFGSVASSAMTMTGKQVVLTWIVGASALLYLLLAISLTANFGSLGTAFATLISVSLRAISCHVYLWRTSGYVLAPSFTSENGGRPRV